MKILPLFHAQVHICMHVKCVCMCVLLMANCHPPADIPYCNKEGSVILTHTVSEDTSAGVVQICHYGVWIPICGKSWNDFEASLACQQLGFVGEWHFFSSNCLNSLGSSV